MQKFYHFMRAYHNVQKFIIKYTVKYIIKAIYNICTPLSTNLLKNLLFQLRFVYRRRISHLGRGDTVVFGDRPGEIRELHISAFLSNLGDRHIAEIMEEIFGFAHTHLEYI